MMSEPPPKKKLCQLSILSMLPRKEIRIPVGSDSGSTSTDKSLKRVSIESTKNQECSSVHQSDSKDNMTTERLERCSLLARAAERRKNSPQSSPDMFDSPPQSPCSSISWRGTPLPALTTLGVTNMNIPPVVPAPDHKVLIELPLPAEGLPKAFPSAYNDIWDHSHVRMPNSPSSLYPKKMAGEKTVLVPRWNLICDALNRPIKTFASLHQAILSYNHRYESKWKFLGLKVLLEEEFCEEEQDHFFDVILPGIIELALSLPSLVTTPPPFLKCQSNDSLTLSQKQVASLLANAFLCTFPRRNAKGADKEYSSYPDINFNRLFSHNKQRALEKLKCVVHYFKEMLTKGRDGVITFSRQNLSLEESQHLEASSKPLLRLHIDSEGLIEDTPGLLQVDFANKYLGGGVLGLGCVQEEIRFVLCPELLLTRLFTECLDKRDALLVIGVEQFSNGEGYASTFKWKSSHRDDTPRDSFRRKLCQVVALDALRFTKTSLQYKPQAVMREVVKAYAGFRTLLGAEGDPVAVASGNWGCGAFNGDPYLKGLIQLVAAAEAGRDVAYFTFGDQKLRDKLHDMHQYLLDKNISVGELVMILSQYGTRDGADGKDLYHYIRYNLSADNSDTDSRSSLEIIDSEQKKASNTLKQTANTVSKYSKSTSTSTSVSRCSESDRQVTIGQIDSILDQCEKSLSNKSEDEEENDDVRPKSGASPGDLFDCLDKIDKNLN